MPTRHMGWALTIARNGALIAVLVAVMVAGGAAGCGEVTVEGAERCEVDGDCSGGFLCEEGLCAGCATDGQCRERHRGFVCETDGSCSRQGAEGDFLLVVQVGGGAPVTNPSEPVGGTATGGTTEIGLDASRSLYIGTGQPSFRWELINGAGLGIPLRDAMEARAVFDAPAIAESTVIMFRVTADDGSGSAAGLASADVHVTIQPASGANAPPTVVAEASVERAAAGETVVLSAEGTVDPNGDELALPFVWSQRAGVAVELTDASDDGSFSSVSFVAPTVWSDETLTFVVSVADVNADPRTGTAEVSVVIEGEPAPCDGDGDCDDGNPCTDDRCDLTAGGCVSDRLPDGSFCDDGDDCTTNDRCLQGTCAGNARACDDGNPCTRDSCEGGACANAFMEDGAACDDGNACTADETCTSGVCSGTLTSCDDGDVCTFDRCDPTVGCVNDALSDGTFCDDGDSCTTNDHCEAGACTGRALACDDGNPCTHDRCDDAEGCVNEPHADACDDGNACTGDDVCAGGVCAGVATDCDDGNPCTTDSCQPDSGCVNAPNTLPCDDGDACTTGDHCVEGLCVGAGQRVCDDGSDCTTDTCDAELGCVNAPLPRGTTCDDGNACTRDDTCVETDCVGVPSPDDCPCASDEDCAAFDDTDLCNGSFRCERALGLCVLDPATVVSCDEEPASACSHHVCVPDTGACEEASRNDTLPCDDGDPCTSGTVCAEGICGGGAPTLCDDGNPCTDDRCDETEGCVFEPNTATCDDGDACTVGDGCRDGQCGATDLRDCDDGNACTLDWCLPTEGCVNVDTTADCDDGDPCTAGDYCAEGVCVPGSAVSCDDRNLCTDDSCAEGVGCVNTPVAERACDDQNACTVDDVCSASGVCLPGTPAVCDDADPCTADHCEPASGCVSPAAEDGLGCDDGDPCTTASSCLSGVCTGTAELSCDDTNPCTADTCEPESGCRNAPLDSGTCDDGDRCTSGDSCVQGECVGTADPALCGCTVDSDCADTDLCNGEEYCDKSGEAWTCATRPGSVVVCPTEQDSTCAHSVCDPTDGQCALVPRNQGQGCDDGDACSTASVCDDGTCTGTAWLTCDDGNVCTDDTCVATSGCTFEPISGRCDDGNACTMDDVCTDGVCGGTAPLDCDDGNDCTEDRCEPAQGCVNAPLTGVVCDDGDACSVEDVCDAGVCAPGPGRSCDDDDPCTDDSCDPVQGCQYENNEAVCDDGLYCTITDRCQDGACGGAVRDCDDGELCTVDTCSESQDRCVHTPVATDCCVRDTDCVDGDPCTQDVCDLANNRCDNAALPYGTPCTPSGGATYGALCDADGSCRAFTRDLYPNPAEYPTSEGIYVLRSIDQKYASWSPDVVGVYAEDPRLGPYHGLTGLIAVSKLKDMAVLAPAGFRDVSFGLAVGDGGMASLQSDGTWTMLNPQDLGLDLQVYRSFVGVLGADRTPTSSFDLVESWLLVSDVEELWRCTRVTIRGTSTWSCAVEPFDARFTTKGGPLWGPRYDANDGYGETLHEVWHLANLSDESGSIYYNPFPLSGQGEWIDSAPGCAGSLCPGRGQRWNDAHGDLTRDVVQIWGVGDEGQIARTNRTDQMWQTLTVPAEMLWGHDASEVTWRGVFVDSLGVYLTGYLDACVDERLCIEGDDYRTFILMVYSRAAGQFRHAVALDSFRSSGLNGEGPNLTASVVNDVWVAEATSGYMDVWVVGGAPPSDQAPNDDVRAALYRVRLAR